MRDKEHCKEHYAAVLPDGREYCETTSFGFGPDQVAQNAVRHFKLTTPRCAPQRVQVVVFRLYIDDKTHQMARKKVGEYQIQPWLEPMTEAEYAAELEEVLAELPEEFRSFVSSRAWDEGHSAGYEEVVLLAKSLVEGLSVAVMHYARRIAVRG